MVLKRRAELEQHGGREEDAFKIFVRIRGLNSYARRGPVIAKTANGHYNTSHDVYTNLGKSLPVVDKVYGTEKRNDVICHDVVLDLSTTIRKGHDAILLAYGQSGSGKTYSFFGDLKNPGLVQCFGAHLLSKGSFEVQVVQYYNGVCYDVIRDPGGNEADRLAPKDKNKLYPPKSGALAAASVEKGDFAKKTMTTTSDVSALVLDIGRKRLRRKTNWNPVASRSHFILHLSLEGIECDIY